jgi:hypothetical protein
MSAFPSEYKPFLSKSTGQGRVTPSIRRLPIVVRACHLSSINVQTLLRKEGMRLSMGQVGQSSLVPELC